VSVILAVVGDCARTDDGVALEQQTSQQTIGRTPAARKPNRPRRGRISGSDETWLQRAGNVWPMG
jgi:hypothetical protein